MSRALEILPSALSGSLAVPPSKSYAHRAVIAAALARGTSRVMGLELSEDIRATMDAVAALGARVELTGAGERFDAAIAGIGHSPDMPRIDCRESGSTLRFMLPVALAAAGGAVFTGSGRLGKRPIGPYIDIFRKQGIEVSITDGGFPLSVKGVLKPGEFMIPGGISSQFITGLMMALPLLPGDSDIRVDGNLESIGYVDITMDVLKSFGVAVSEEWLGEWYTIRGSQKYQSSDYMIEGDWSQAAFPLLLGLLGGGVRLAGLNRESRQGDRAIEAIFRGMGGDVRWEDGALVASKSRLRGISADVSQCPDLAPAIAAALAVAEGLGRITGGRRLRDKESNRIRSIAGCLHALGADVTETDDGMIFAGNPGLKGGGCSSAGDHRIAMMAAAVSPACAGPVALSGWEAVAKSWPGFWDEFRGLGGRTNG